MAKGADTSQEINTYEEARKQRLQDNLKRFEDLGILKISKSLSGITDSEKKSPQRPAKPKPKGSIDMLELRRSSRARNPVPSYAEEPGISLSTPRKRSKTGSSWKSYLARPANEVKFASKEERACAMRSAKMLQNNLGSKNPSFVKSMLRSHVYSCFWLGLPNDFFKAHLPSEEVRMILEDEDGLEYDAIYIGIRGGLSGGWRAFALDHKLDDGDALVFELSEPTRFKIYIVRASGFGQENTRNFLDEKVNGITNDGGKVKQKTKAENVTNVEADEGIVSQKRKQNVELNGKSKVQEEKKTVNGTRSASKNKKLKTGLNGEIGVNDEKIEANVQKEKIAEEGKRNASPERQQKAGVSGKSEVKQEKIVGIVERSLSLKAKKFQQQVDGNKLSRKRSVPTKLFRRKVY